MVFGVGIGRNRFGVRLRAAFRHGLKRYPFTIEGIVILPDHLHTIWRLPEGDNNFSIRWMVIKRKFSAGLSANPVNSSKQAKREKGVWQRRLWEHSLRDQDDWRRYKGIEDTLLLPLPQTRPPRAVS